MINQRKEMVTLRKNPKQMLDIKSTVTEMKNVFNRLFSRLHSAKKDLMRLKKMSIKTSKIEG